MTERNAPETYPNPTHTRILQPKALHPHCSISSYLMRFQVMELGAAAFMQYAFVLPSLIRLLLNFNPSTS
jgi:hypothetical protein